MTDRADLAITSERADALQRRVAGALAARGVQAGDRIAAVVDTPAPEWLAVVGGAIRAGVVPAMVHPQLTAIERQRLLDDARPSLVIDRRDLVDELMAGTPAALPTWPRVRPMHFTSGTTGTPKGVWSGDLDPASAEELWREEIDQWSFGPGDVHLVCSPLHHSAPLRFALSALLAGGTVVVPPRFTAESAADLIAEHAVTTTFVSPAHLQRFHAAGRLAALGALRLVLHAGAPCPSDLKRATIDVVGADGLWEFYGSTEGQFTVCPSHEWLAHPGTVGRPRPGRRLEIRDGVIWCAPPPHARWQYWSDPAKTAQAWDGDWFTVGDLGELRDGLLYLTGRRNDLIISGGVNVYPLEVEQAIAEFTGIDDVAVFPRDDEQWGQRVCAAIVGEVDLGALGEFVAARLAPYKRPKEYHRVTQIPKTELGKVLRPLLADQLGLDGLARSTT